LQKPAGGLGQEMNLPYVFNTFFASALIIIITFAECAVKYSSDKIIKNIFCTFLLIAFFSLITDFLFTFYDTVYLNINLNNNLRLMINYLPVFSALLIIIYIRKMYRKVNVTIFILLIFFIITLTNNILIGSLKLIWPIIAAMLLYTYLFIILKENKIDNLTGLDNRYSFFEYFNKLTRGKNNDIWKISMIDVNNFRSINEIYGHLEGDNALCALAQIIKSCARRSDFTARYGGDEFVLVTRAEKDAVELIDRIEEELAKFNKKSGKPYEIEINYGYDTYTADGSRPTDEVLNYIDKLTHRYNEKNRRAGDLKQ